MSERSTFEEDLRELKHVKRMQDVLVVPAHLFATTSPDCTGDCDEPVYTDLPNGTRMPCCAFKVLCDLKVTLRSQERLAQRRVDLALSQVPPKQTFRQEVIAALALKAAMPRDFTGTFIGRRNELLKGRT